MAGIDVATRVVRDCLAVSLTLPPTPAADAVHRPFSLARREAQQSTTTAPRLAPTGTVPLAPAAGPDTPAVAARVQATLASDRALFSIVTAGRQSIVEQANLMASENAQGFLPFTVLFGSSVPMPAMPTTKQTNLRREAAQAADKARVAAAYADPRGPAAPAR